MSQCARPLEPSPASCSSPSSQRPASDAIGAEGRSLTQVLPGYTRPLLVTHAPGGGREIFIVEQTGRIERATYEDGRWQKLGTFLDLRAWSTTRAVTATSAVSWAWPSIRATGTTAAST